MRMLISRNLAVLAAFIFASSLLLVVFPWAASPVAQQATLEVTYLANEGFLLSDGSHKVLIDALFGPGLPGYERVPDSARAELEAAEPPFDGVDLVLATHFHKDHFDPAAVVRHLSANPKATFVGPQQAARQLEAEYAPHPTIRSRVMGLTLDWNTKEDVTVSGVALKVMRIHHGDFENLGYILTLGGKRILHVGDSDADAAAYARLGLAAERIDIAFIPYWQLQDSGGQSLVRDQIRPRMVIAMHIPEANSSDASMKAYVDRVGGIEGIRRSVRSYFPDVVIFEALLTTKRL